LTNVTMVYYTCQKINRKGVLPPNSSSVG